MHRSSDAPPLLKEKAEILNGNPKYIIEFLNGRGYKNLYIDGGKTIQNFLELEQVDEMILSIIPILLGSGIPLFGNLKNEQKFKHVKMIWCNK